MLQSLPASKWNRRNAAHLLNRAGFGSTPQEIEDFTKLSHAEAVNRLVEYEKNPVSSDDPAWARPDPERMEKLAELRNIQKSVKSGTEEERRAGRLKVQEMQKMDRQLQRSRIIELRGWWLKRMAEGGRPLEEKMTLFWHGHFATSVVKVKDAYYTWLQNETFRRNATGNWSKLLTEASKDPSMLIWLDQAQSKKGHPNENFAREVMELFALGEGHYTEKDITEAARAFTGWALNRGRQQFFFAPAMHDRGPKTIFGKTGNFNGDEVLKLIIERPQADVYITSKIWRFFAEEEPIPEVAEKLAVSFRHHGREFKPLLREMFLSEAFYTDAIIRNQVKSPVQWLVGSVRLLERDLPPAPEAAQVLSQLGQDLFAPPNVKGWDGGVTWITTNSLLDRYNFAAYLVFGGNKGADLLKNKNKELRKRTTALKAVDKRFPPIHVEKLFSAEVRSDKRKLAEALQLRLLQTYLKENQLTAIKEYLSAQGELDEEDILHAIRLIMSTPEYQLT